VKKIFGLGTFQVGWSATANKQYFILGLIFVVLEKKKISKKIPHNMKIPLQILNFFKLS
jgi:hypothetical protein